MRGLLFTLVLSLYSTCSAQMIISVYIFDILVDTFLMSGAFLKLGETLEARGSLSMSLVPSLRLERGQVPADSISAALELGRAESRLRQRLQEWNVMLQVTFEKIIGANLPTIQDLYTFRVRKRAGKITADPSHPGHKLFKLLPSGRRYRSLFAKTSRHKNSLFPLAVSLLNS